MRTISKLIYVACDGQEFDNEEDCRQHELYMLKPCPFCGGLARYRNDAYELYAECTECGAKTESVSYSMSYNYKLMVCEKWNRRYEK
jgi:Lar family restriction alleviation protein